MLKPAYANEGNKNDMMCMAIYFTAYKQYDAELNEIKTSDSADLGRAMILQIHLEHYSPRIALFQWQYHRGDANSKQRFNLFVDRYVKEIDTATALLHWDRCEHRTDVLYSEYLTSKN